MFFPIFFYTVSTRGWGLERFLKAYRKYSFEMGIEFKPSTARRGFYDDLRDIVTNNNPKSSRVIRAQALLTLNGNFKVRNKISAKLDGTYGTNRL